ncbi:hypothetical protein HYV74_04055 [Candidatus Uhrbacteria bacterium]|nr:hypothetical protein [Candidatus Uhrbacteria bacterium]
MSTPQTRWHRLAPLLVLCALALLPQSVSAGWFDWLFPPPPPPPPPPALEVRCDDALRWTIPNVELGQYRTCPKAGEAYAGDILIIDAKHFPADSEAKPARIAKLYIYQNGQWPTRALTYGPTRTGNGNFRLMALVPSSLAPGNYTFILRVVDTCGTPCTRPIQYEGLCPSTECLQEHRDVFVQASFDLRIRDPKQEVRPPINPGNGPFDFTCSWTEKTWNAATEQFDTVKKSSKDTCPGGSSFSLNAGPFPRAYRDEMLKVYLRGPADAMGLCKDGAEGPTQYGHNGFCYFPQYTPFAGRTCDPMIVFQGPRCRQGKSDPMTCDGPNRPHSQTPTNCRIAVQHHLVAPPGTTYALVVRNSWASNPPTPDRWEVVGQSVLITEPITEPKQTYRGKQFTVTLDRDQLTFENPYGYPTLVPQYIRKGQLIPGARFQLPVRWDAPAGTTFPFFPRHKMQLVLDADSAGNGGTVLREGNAAEAKSGKTTTWENLQSPSDLQPGRHRLTIRCTNCDDQLTVGDPAIGNRPRPVFYVPTSVEVEVVDLAALPLPALRVQPTAVAPHGTITVFGTNFPPDARITEVTIAGRGGSATLGSTYRAPPYERFTFTVEGQRVTKEQPRIDVPVASDGRMALVIPLPPLAGDLVAGRGEVRVEVTVRDGATTFKKQTTFTIDASDCPLGAERPILSFGKERSDWMAPTVPVTTAAPLGYFQGQTAEIYGKHFACRSPITKVTATWKSGGNTYGPIALPLRKLEREEAAPFAVVGQEATNHDGTIGGSSGLALRPTGSLWWRNHLDVDHVLIAITDQSGRTSAPTRLELQSPPFRATPVTPSGVAAGERAAIRLSGFTSGHRIVIAPLPNEGLGNEPLEYAENLTWNTALGKRFAQLTKNFRLERNPDTVDYQIPSDLTTGVHTFAVVDTTEGEEARVDLSRLHHQLLRSRPRALFTMEIGGKKTAPDDQKDQKTDIPGKENLAITVAPTTAAPGTRITITLAQFTPNSVPTITLGGDRISRFTEYTDGRGALMKQYEIPKSQTPGTYPITATDQSGAKVAASLVVNGVAAPPTLTIDPTTTTSASSVVVRGKNWGDGPWTITMRLANGKGKEYPLPIDINLCARTVKAEECQDGDLAVKVILPEALEPGTYRVNVAGTTVSKSATLTIIAQDIQEGTEAAIAITPTTGAPGTSVIISGTRFQPNSNVIIKFDEQVLRAQRGATRTDARGAFSGITVTVPITTAAKHQITVLDGQGHRTSTAFIVGAIKEADGDEKKKEEQKETPCNPDLPSFYEGACPKGTTPEQKKEEPKKDAPCDPNLPSWWAGACPAKSNAPTPEPKKETPQPETPKSNPPCNPDLPSWWEGACKPSEPSPLPAPQPPVDTSKCNPLAPSYTQPPECRSAAAPTSNTIAAGAALLNRVVEPLLALFTMPTSAAAAKAPAFTSKFMAGSYRCWSYNVSGGGGSCRLAPPLELKANGTYTMSSERGRFTVRGNQLTLSQSKLRGKGTVSEDGMRILFEYPYNGWQHTVTYLRSTPLPGSVAVELTIRYPEEQGWLDWVSTVALEPTNGSATRYDGVATAPDRRTIKTTYNRGVMGGLTYRVFVSTGTDRQEVGVLDLRKQRGGSITRTIDAPLPKPTATEPADPPVAPIIVPIVPAMPTTPTTPVTPPASSGIPCDPNVPKYSQPGCVDPDAPVVSSPPPTASPIIETPIFGTLSEGPTWNAPPPPADPTPASPPASSPSAPPRKNIGDPWTDSYENEDTPIREYYRTHPGATMGPPLLRYNLPSGIF